MLQDIFEALKRIGFHGAIGLAVVLGLLFVVVYGFIHRPDHEITGQAVTVLLTGVGAVIGAAVMVFKGGPGGD